MKVREAIAGAGIDPREARILLSEVCGFSMATLIAGSEREIPFEVENAFVDFVRRRKAGEPVAYILGHKEFYGLDLAVNPSVLIPRPETELLVELAIQREPNSILDLGTGSGAVALAIKHERPGCKVVAVDADLSALNTAKRNAGKLNLEIDFRHGRWFEPAKGERFQLIVSNPPYVAEGDPHLDELRHEPRSALLAGPEGLDCIRDIVKGAPDHILPDGWLLLEHGIGQERAVRNLLAESDFASVTTWPDLAGISRVSGGKR